MSIGDYIVIIISIICGISGVMDVVSQEGFQGYAFTSGMLIGSILGWLIVGYIGLFAFRYVREHFFN
jgi:uncharacterized membrane protein YedE/YeeE